MILENSYQRQCSCPKWEKKVNSFSLKARCGGRCWRTRLHTLAPLVGSGVGHLVICDNDVVSLSNLPRQTLYTMAQIGQPKSVLAAEHLRANNPHCEVEVVCERLREENAAQILDNCDLIVDATDNESTRRLLDRYAQSHSTPWLYISVEGWQGQIALFDAQHPTYGALFPIEDMK